MRFDYLPCYAIATLHEDVLGLRLKSYEKFIQKLGDYQVNVGDYATFHAFDIDLKFSGLEGDSEERDFLSIKRTTDLKILFENFTKEFYKETGIKIGIYYHDSVEDGNDCDEVDGGFYFLDVEDIYELTPDAAKLSELTEINTDARFMVNGKSTIVIEIKAENIQKLNIESFTSFLLLANSYNVDLDNFSEYYLKSNKSLKEETLLFDRKNKSINNPETLLSLFNEFRREFNSKTNLSINISFHDSGNTGSYFDDIDGYYFYLNFDEFYTETESAIRIKDELKYEKVYYSQRK